MSNMIVIDLDGTLTLPANGRDYAALAPNQAVVSQLRHYAGQGYRIAVMTSRSMRSFDKNLGRINAETLPAIVEWLKRHDIPFDEIHIGKPWCGPLGFYVDDRAVRPSEFVALDHPAITELLERERSV
jgi:Predicted hydrolases of the HAD superfamily